MEILKKKQKPTSLCSIYYISNPSSPSKFGTNVGGTIAFVTNYGFLHQEYFNKNLNIKRLILIIIGLVLAISLIAILI